MSSHIGHHTPRVAALVKDPVCGMDVNLATSEHHVELAGRNHHSYSGHCLARFVADAPYLNAKSAAVRDQAVGEAAEGPSPCTRRSGNPARLPPRTSGFAANHPGIRPVRGYLPDHVSNDGSTGGSPSSSPDRPGHLGSACADMLWSYRSGPSIMARPTCCGRWSV